MVTTAAVEGPAGGRGGVPRTVLAYLAPAVLTAVAVHQIVWSANSTLTPWKGGGFGMFSSVESPRERFLRVHLTLRGQKEPVPAELPSSVRRQVEQLKAYPNQPATEQLAGLLLARTWIDRRALGQSAVARTELDPETIRTEFASQARPRAVALEKGDIAPPADQVMAVERVSLEVLGYHYDRVQQTMTVRPFASATVAHPEGQP